LGYANANGRAGNLFLAMAVTLASLERSEESFKSLESSHYYFTNDSEQQNEWTACIDIRMADHHYIKGEFKAAYALLQSSLDFFEAQPTNPTLEAHLARILFRQSLLYKAEGKRSRSRAALTAAKETLLDTINTLTEDRIKAIQDSISSSELTARDFDQFVEPWHR
jgi:hypothetical protein